MSTPPHPRSTHPIPSAILASVVQQTPAMVLLTDLDGKIVFVNEGFTDTTGYTADEALGQTPALLRSGLRDRDFYAHLWQTLLEGRNWNMVIPNRRKDGSIYWQQTNIFPVTDDTGDVVYFAGVGRDVSDRVKITEDLAAARDAAEAAAQVKSDFLVNMSHEIRTPLNAVLGMADLLTDTALDARQRGQLDVLRRAGESLLGLVNEIMDLSKLEAGGMQLGDQLFDLRDLLEGATSVVAPIAHRRGLELLLRLDPEADRLWRGDPVRVRQIVMNLLSNAVKFTETGEVEVTARAAEGAGPGGVWLEVRDTGAGIAADRLDSVFERFTQVDGSRTRRHGGAGLGLALSRELCHLMGGTLTAESALGEGSTFTAALPLSGEPRTGGPPALPRAMRLLVADDHPIHRSILASQLASAGAEVVEVPALSDVGPAMAEARSEGHPFDVVVLDDTWAKGRVEDTVDELARRSPPPGIVLITRVQDEHDTGDSVAHHVTQPAARASLLEAVAKADRRALHGVVQAPEGPTWTREASSQPVAADEDWPRRVLVVDDNAVNRLLVHALLDKEGSIVEEVPSGSEALVRLTRDPAVDLVLMDLVMPGMDGFETVRELRRREQERGSHATPVIAFSAATAPEQIRAAIEAGCDGHIGKPVLKDELLSEVRRATRRRRPARV